MIGGGGTKFFVSVLMSNLSLFEYKVVTVDATGQECDRYRSSSRYRVEDLGREIVLEMVAIPGGTFCIGSPQTEEGWHSSQSPQHLATIKPFFIGKYPVTQTQWQIVAALPKVKQDLNPNPANFLGEDRPVEQVSWYDAIEFCARLSQQTGYDYRLPTEAQWEYACRAHTLTPFHFGETITTDLANYSGVDWEYMGKICSKGSYGAGPKGCDRRETTPVGSFQVANGFGLYYLHGNVREWCADYWHDNYEGAPIDGSAWITGGDSNKRVLRGGSWNVSPKKCRSAYRVKFDPNASLYDIGFRVVHS
ncbi:formylglycine-generating enzyme family protein [Candidatus Gracilibacteria bacterium]|nr:formylglycine-generating enzyme family protein [Candidatus Gracilibacteria bacterium]